MDPKTFVKLKRLSNRDDEPIEDIMKRSAAKLGDLRTEGTFELRVQGEGDTNEATSYSMRFTPAGTTLLPGRVQDPTLVTSVTHEAFRKIVYGSYSPLQAYLDGTLKLQGDAQLGRQIMRTLAGSGTTDGVCPVLYFAGYSPVGGGGSLTLRGAFFTPGGTIDIGYNFGGGGVFGGPLRQITADKAGKFDVTEGGIPCGEIPARQAWE